VRIHRLEIGTSPSASGFKNLTDVTVEFDAVSATSVLVGRNGTGKSNILEALTIIFRDLDLGETDPAFQYRLEYTCRGRRVCVDADPDRARAKMTIMVDGESISLGKLASDPERTFLPRYVFGYYSGPSYRMQEHFVKHQEQFYKALIGSKAGDSLPLRPLFFAQHIHSQFVLLAFFLEQDREALAFLDEVLGITGLDSVLFVMKKPPWTSKEGDPRFWNARGTVAELLAGLHKRALAPMRQQWRVPLGFRKKVRLDHLYLYLDSANALEGLKSGYETQQDFFKALESTYISELIREVRTRVRVRGLDTPLTFRELSEGEQQLLMVLGLLRFTKEEESLFLLDEPDTHLNPAWSVRYLDLLQNIGGLGDNGHVIMATHDPLVISGLTRQQVRLLERSSQTGRIVAHAPYHLKHEASRRARQTIFIQISQKVTQIQNAEDPSLTVAQRRARTRQPNGRRPEPHRVPLGGQHHLASSVLAWRVVSALEEDDQRAPQEHLFRRRVGRTSSCPEIPDNCRHRWQDLRCGSLQPGNHRKPGEAARIS